MWGSKELTWHHRLHSWKNPQRGGRPLGWISDPFNRDLYGGSCDDSLHLRLSHRLGLHASEDVGKSTDEVTRQRGRIDARLEGDMSCVFYGQ